MNTPILCYKNRSDLATSLKKLLLLMTRGCISSSEELVLRNLMTKNSSRRKQSKKSRNWAVKKPLFLTEKWRFFSLKNEKTKEILIQSWKIKIFFIFFILRLWDLLLIFLQCCNVKNFHGKEEILGPKLG